MLVFPAADGRLDVLARFWCPEEGIVERSRIDAVPYADWARDGYLRATEGNVTGYDVIREDIKTLAETYAIEGIGYDRWNASHLVTQLVGDGAPMVPTGQGFADLHPLARKAAKLVAWLHRVPLRRGPRVSATLETRHCPDLSRRSSSVTEVAGREEPARSGRTATVVLAAPVWADPAHRRAPSFRAEGVERATVGWQGPQDASGPPPRPTFGIVCPSKLTRDRVASAASSSG